MIVGILGLGLIGGSTARAYAKAGHTVYACEKDENILSFAELAGVCQGALDTTRISQCDLIILAIYPEGSVQWLEENACHISPSAVVIDFCGNKRKVCEKCFSLAQKFGFLFVGGHPMAGSHFSGFKYSRSNLFQGAPIVLVPPVFDDMELLERIKNLIEPCGFGRFSITTADIHDKMIAFTSQMPHILSNAYIKSPNALNHKGFSAGSYKDMTRVAWLNPQMWAELFLDNQDNILNELDFYIQNLQTYREAIAAGDKETLIHLLEEGKMIKELVDR